MAIERGQNNIYEELAKFNRVTARVVAIKLGERDDCGREGIDAEIKFLRNNGFNVPAIVRLVIQNSQTGK